MSMRARIEAARSLAYVAAGASDLAHSHPDATVRQEQRAFFEYLVPVVKGCSTEMGVEVASDGVQVHGGVGFIEETGAAQHYRDARILPIYEGTTAIQANDLVGRKTVRDHGCTAKSIVEMVLATAHELKDASSIDMEAIGVQLENAALALSDVIDYIVGNAKLDIKAVYAGSVSYLKMAGTVLGGWQLARAALIAERHLEDGDVDEPFYRAKIASARFFAQHHLPQAVALRTSILEGGNAVFALDDDAF
jgi:butyryl-CoA dehydrogenase